MVIAPDNLKFAVLRSDRNESVINEDFKAFVEHYGCAVYPAHACHLKDKALVENAVKLTYRSVYTDIEGLMFHNLNSLNLAIRASLEKFNTGRMASHKHSRRELFEQMGADYLRSLPAMRYQMKERRTVTVMRSSYVTLFKYHYSVPKEYIGKRVDIVYDADMLEIFHGLRHVTTHHRDDTPYGYTQKASHHLSSRHGSYEKDLGEIFQRAASIDNIVLVYLKEVTAHKRYLPIAFRSCYGILSLEENTGWDSLWLYAHVLRRLVFTDIYQEVLDILEKGGDADLLPSAVGCGMEGGLSVLPRHKNIHRHEYFSKTITPNNLKTDNNGNK